MSPARWERVKQITADALETSPDKRAAFVEDACSGDRDISREVHRLLMAAESSSGGFLEPRWNVRDFLAQQFPQGPTFSSGEVLAGRFKIIRFLNRGGMGEVYSAWQLDLQEVVALKTIRTEISSSPPVIERFKQEVKQTRQITHPNVCRTNEIFVHEGPSGSPVWFLTMKLLDGPSLAEYMAENGPLREDQAVPLILDMIAGLSAAHRLDVVHRDFKPGNVMLVVEDGKRRAVVTDFGLATSVPAGGAAGIEGTPAYMSPEQLGGDPVGIAADQFALGLVIWEMLTGTLLDAASLGHRQLKRSLRSQEERRLSAPMREVIERCLQVEQDHRFRNILDIVPILDGTRHRLRVRRMAAAGIAAVAILGAAGAIALPDWGDRISGATALTSDMDVSTDPSLSPDGKWLTFSSDRAESGNLDIWLQRMGAGTARRLTSNAADDAQPSISPDGKLVAFRSERDGGGIYVIGSDGTGERLLARGGRNPAFSPEGQTIAYWAGDPDDSVASGQLFTVSVGGGSPHRIAADFQDARYPTWNSDGRLLLFDGCRSPARYPAGADWWVVHADGSEAAKLGVIPILKDAHIEPQVTPSKSWRGNKVMFSGRNGALVPLWEVTVSPDGLRLVAKPRQVISGAKDLAPSLAETGAIAFDRASGSLHLWRIPTNRPGRSDAVRVTDSPLSDGCPSVSRDGRRLFFTRRTDDFRQIMAKDLTSGQETVSVETSEDKFWPTPDAKGDRIAFESRGRDKSSIDLFLLGHGIRTLCTGCSHPASWFGDRSVLYTTESGSIAAIDIANNLSHLVVAAPPGFFLSDPDWSPDQGYLLFTSRTESTRQVFAVHLSPLAASADGPWVPITSEADLADHPRWAIGSTTVFYLSRRDGNYCVWSRHFNPNAAQAAGETTEILPFHTQRFTPNRTGATVLGVSVSAESLFINVGDVISSIWTGTLGPGLPPFFRSVALQSH
jgi:serine/threonine protein kinase